MRGCGTGWRRRRRWADGARTVWQAAATKSNQPDKRGGKVLGSRFSENLNNATDPLTIQQQTIVGLEDPDHIGASFVLAQRFVINWEQILSMAPQQVEDLVGRTTDDTLIPSRDDRSHIKRARAQDEQGNTMSVLRLGLPFGRSTAVERNDLLEKGASRRDEEGIYFAGYAKSARVLETIMDRQIGDEPGFMADRLLAHVKSNLGGFYYIPSLPDLGLPVESPARGRHLAQALSGCRLVAARSPLRPEVRQRLHALQPQGVPVSHGDDDRRGAARSSSRPRTGCSRSWPTRSRAGRTTGTSTGPSRRCRTCASTWSATSARPRPTR